MPVTAGPHQAGPRPGRATARGGLAILAGPAPALQTHLAKFPAASLGFGNGERRRPYPPHFPFLRGGTAVFRRHESSTLLLAREPVSLYRMFRKGTLGGLLPGRGNPPSASETAAGLENGFAPAGLTPRDVRPRSPPRVAENVSGRSGSATLFGRFD